MDGWMDRQTNECMNLKLFTPVVKYLGSDIRPTLAPQCDFVQVT